MRANAQMKQTDTDAQSNRVEPKLWTLVILSEVYARVYRPLMHPWNTESVYST